MVQYKIWYIFIKVTYDFIFVILTVKIISPFLADKRQISSVQNNIIFV